MFFIPHMQIVKKSHTLLYENHTLFGNGHLIYMHF